jgi:hypothetical protein
MVKMKTSNNENATDLVIKVGENFMAEIISKNRLTKIGNALTGTYVEEGTGKVLPIFDPSLHGAVLAAEARGLKAKGIVLPSGKAIDPADTSSISDLRALAIMHMESKGVVSTGPKKRDIAAAFKGAVAEMLEDLDTSMISDYPGWGFKVLFSDGMLKVEKVEKHRVK